MNAKEIRIKGLQYCKSRAIENPYCRCDGCPFEDKIMCIDEYGALCMQKTNPDFEDFARDYNFMIKELYREDKE